MAPLVDGQSVERDAIDIERHLHLGNWARPPNAPGQRTRAVGPVILVQFLGIDEFGADDA